MYTLHAYVVIELMEIPTSNGIIINIMYKHGFFFIIVITPY